MTKSPQWDRHSILAELRRHSMTLAGIAERYNLAASSVKNIWTRPNEKVERAVADFIGVPVEQVFADRYPKNRNRILRQPVGQSHKTHVKHADAQRRKAA